MSDPAPQINPLTEATKVSMLIFTLSSETCCCRLASRHRVLTRAEIGQHPRQSLACVQRHGCNGSSRCATIWLSCCGCVLLVEFSLARVNVNWLRHVPSNAD
ncbi:hypothetical protein N658DRAFT_198908 [Parathielavia hyrcaniae]|uniref:Uncharacterized protein n=1 Tax=Parathielavia hyrcaniae TaxID=113614 RepID=A0AAN6Q8T8_9PEZI|nr:hypothetical protein N658DRAFT_198908 [Parathielavia hyrcaniae]